MKREIIRQIKSELHMLEVASLPNEFDKHLYVIETLVTILKEQGPRGSDADIATRKEEAEPKLADKDERMLELMGGSGKQDAGQEDMRKNDSIFDF